MNSIEQTLKRRLPSIDSMIPIQGGDIGLSFQILTRGESCFCKVYQSVDHAEMIRAEWNGLKFLRGHGLPVPDLIDVFHNEAFSGIILKYIHSGRKEPQTGGEVIASLHGVQEQLFGFSRSSFIGSAAIQNTRNENWADFWWETRVLPFYKEVYAEANSSIRQGMKWIERNREQLFPVETPVLLHGDLWSGNFIYSSSGQPYFVDPSIYFGHREMDISMMVLFGGFGEELGVYQEICPLEKGWQQRVFWNQLYPLMVHWIFFGGAYAMQIEQGFREKGITR